MANVGRTGRAESKKCTGRFAVRPPSLNQFVSNVGRTTAAAHSWGVPAGWPVRQVATAFDRARLAEEA